MDKRTLPAGRRVLRWAARGMVVALVGYVVSTIPGVRSGSGYDVLLDGWLNNGILVFAGVLIGARVWLVDRDRLAWAMIGVAVELYAIGNILYVVWVQYLDPIPYPSVADFFWLVFYAFPYAGVVLLVRRRVRAFHASMWLDGIVGALGTAAYASLALDVVARTTGGATAAIATTMAYPIGDLLVLMLIVGVFGLVGWRPDRAWAYLGLGLLLFAAADTIYLLRVATETYQAGTLLDPLWALGSVAMTFAALREPSDEPMRLEGWAVLVLPSLFTVGALGLLVYAALHHLPTISVVLATLTVLTGVVRAGMTFREVQALADIRRQARTDELTGLGNRRSFYESVERRLDAPTPGAQVAVLIVDLDRFKEVNDSLGHAAGDELLVEVGRRLAAHMRQDDVLARLGGDEFAVMLGGATAAEAAEVANRLRAELQRVFVLDGVLLHIDASIGIAVCPDVATTISGALQRADIAMYEAKADRTGCVVYQASDDDDLLARLRTTEELRAALHEDQLVLHYQPKVDLGSGALAGVEALVRWQHPRRGLLGPDTFVPLAERAGLMRLLTTRVLEGALAQVRAWWQAGHRIPVAVNVSASSLLDVELPGEIARLLAGHGLPPSALVVEITESTLMVDRTRSLAVLHELRAHGVRISVDDYGTGYSSLAYLRDLPIDELKLDRSFVSDLESDERAAAIVQSTVRLAHSLGLPLVAEGIETEGMLRRLREFGCDLGQGYFLCRPMPAEAVTAWMEQAVGDVPAPRGTDRLETAR